MPKRRTRSRKIFAALSSPLDRVAILEAALLLPLVSIGLRTLGWARIRGFLDRSSAEPARGSLADAQHLAALVEAVARRGPVRYSCLQRSTVLCRILRRRGLEANLRMGVRLDAADGARSFHAWVEHAGVVINDAQHVREGYAAFRASTLGREDV